MVYSLTGHHGTNKTSAYIIHETKNFIISKNEELWLGDGAYFFENNKKMAWNWSKAEGHKKGYKEYGIIEANIEADENTVLNLDTDFGQDFFHLQREAFMERLGKARFSVKAKKKFFDGEVINDMCTIVPYKIVCQKMFVQLVRDRRIKVLSRVPNCRVISVRDNQCIKTPIICEEGVLK